MQSYYFPEIVQVLPCEDHTVFVSFSNGKIVQYDVKPLLDKGGFRALQDMDFFMRRCKIMNDTLAWDVSGKDDPTDCIDIDPETLYELKAVADRLAVS